MNHSHQRSALVTSTAWISIVLGALGVLFSGTEHLFFRFLVSPEWMSEVLATMPMAADLGITADTLIDAAQSVMAVTFVASMIVLVVSVGLLRRRNWARLGFIALLIATIGLNLIGLAVMVVVGEALTPVGASTELMWLNGVLIVAVSVLSGWLAWVLASPPVLEEFGVSPQRAQAE